MPKNKTEKIINKQKEEKKNEKTTNSVFMFGICSLLSFWLFSRFIYYFDSSFILFYCIFSYSLSPHSHLCPVVNIVLYSLFCSFSLNIRWWFALQHSIKIQINFNMRNVFIIFISLWKWMKNEWKKRRRKI